MTRSLNGNGPSPTLADCPPRFATPRNPDRLTLGPKAGEVASQLGKPFMPWQQYVADVALEVDPVTGLLVYREIVLLVPRQSGKTTLILATAVHRALAWATKQNIVYTAQTRNDARKKWEDDHLPLLDLSPIGKRKPKPYRSRMTNGNEALIWRHNGSMYGISASGETSGHGPTLDLGFIDEAFAQKDSRMEQAFKPAQITRDDPQVWVVSTAGRTPGTSPYLWGKVESGRARCAEGHHPGVAYFEWSAADDADREDPETWWATMPALGHTITEAAVRADFESMDPAEFDRAYLNRWNPNAADSVIPSAAWAAAAGDGKMADPVSLAVDVSPDGASAAIAAAGAVGDGFGVEIISHGPSTDWVVAELACIVERNSPKCVMVAAGSPAVALVPELERAGVTVSVVSVADHKSACGHLLSSVVEGRCAHRGQPELDTAVASASRRISGDGWLWSRRSSSVDISPLVAVGLAAWGHLTGPAKSAACAVVFT
jgi:hypothetical protein